MKYMGSKRAMLRNGLGVILQEESESANRIVDLMCGSASVSWFSAIQLKKHVVAFDLQEYATTMASAVLCRTQALSVDVLGRLWLTKARRIRSSTSEWKAAQILDSRNLGILLWQRKARELCDSTPSRMSNIIWNRYGGHYYSPTQAVSLDAMLRALPEQYDLRQVCLASLIMTASKCAASPGHTAQPFKATETAGRYLQEAWHRDPFVYAQQALETLCPLHAYIPGAAFVSDANNAAKDLTERDLVFIDPPYSGVHYSRFYHVLETIARGWCGPVNGVGRYPPATERPSSAYSMRGTSLTAIDDLLATLSSRGCKVVVTFPKGECSNGLSGEMLEGVARQYFNVKKRAVKTRFSTLGGNTNQRVARVISDELMLVLSP